MKGIVENIYCLAQSWIKTLVVIQQVCTAYWLVYDKVFQHKQAMLTVISLENTTANSQWVLFLLTDQILDIKLLQA